MEREKGLLERLSLSERRYQTSLNRASDLVEKGKLAEKLGIGDPREIQYLITTLAWDLRRKKSAEIGYLNKHPIAEASRRTGGIVGWAGRMTDSLANMEEKVIARLLARRTQILQEEPSIVPVASAIARASNLILGRIVQTNLPLPQVLEELEPTITRFCGEISRARERNQQVPTLEV